MALGLLLSTDDDDASIASAEYIKLLKNMILRSRNMETTNLVENTGTKLIEVTDDSQEIS